MSLIPWWNPLYRGVSFKICPLDSHLNSKTLTIVVLHYFLWITRCHLIFFRPWSQFTKLLLPRISITNNDLFQMASQNIEICYRLYFDLVHETVHIWFCKSNGLPAQSFPLSISNIAMLFLSLWINIHCIKYKFVMCFFKVYSDVSEWYIQQPSICGSLSNDPCSSDPIICLPFGCL